MSGEISLYFGRLLLRRWVMFFAMWVSSTLIGVLGGGAAYLFLEVFLAPGAELQRNVAFWAFAAMGFFFGLYGALWYMVKNWKHISELQAIVKARDTGRN